MRLVAWFPHLKAISSRDESGPEEVTAKETGEIEEADKVVVGAIGAESAKVCRPTEKEVVGGTMVPLRGAVAERCGNICKTRASCAEWVRTPEDARGGTGSVGGPPSESQLLRPLW